MNYTDEQKYAALLKEVGELLDKKNLTISINDGTINYLREALTKAEKERDFFKAEVTMLQNDLAKCEAKIAEAKKGA